MSFIKKITLIKFNWHQVNWDNSAGEDYEVRTVGINKVTEINENVPQNDGDKWFYTVHFEDGSYERIFNPNYVLFNKDI